MWDRVLRFRRRQASPDNLMTEFEDTLMLVVDPDQLTSNLLSKLNELAPVEKAFVYLTDRTDLPRSLFPVDTSDSATHRLPNISVDGRTAQWFRVNRQLLFFQRQPDVTVYLKKELQPLLDLSINLAFPLISMDRLIGIVFLHVDDEALDSRRISNVQVLGKQAGLAFENALLFKERLRQNERMFRAEQLATMGQFAAGIAHELRNPLTAIRSTVQHLASDFADGSEQKNLANGILVEVDRLNNLAGNLLSLAEPGESHPEELEISQEIRRCLDFIEAKSKNQSVMLQVDVDENLPNLVFDLTEWRQLLLNVLMNALQAMPDGGTLSVRVCQPAERACNSASGAGEILIEVEDEGPGVPPDLCTKVFEPFFTTKPGGTGLGLAICSGIVKRYNGNIRIDKTERGGACVKISLPVKQNVSF